MPAKAAKPPVRPKRTKTEVQREFEEIQEQAADARESADPKARKVAPVPATSWSPNPRISSAPWVVTSPRIVLRCSPAQAAGSAMPPASSIAGLPGASSTLGKTDSTDIVTVPCRSRVVADATLRQLSSVLSGGPE